MRNKLKESVYEDLDMGISEWFKYLDKLFNFKTFLKMQNIEPDETEKNLISYLQKDEINYTMNFEMFVDELCEFLNRNDFMNKLLDLGNKFIKSQKFIDKKEQFMKNRIIERKNKLIKESSNIIKDLEKVINVAISDAFEDRYVMDFECEGVEPTLVAEKGSGDIRETFANIYPSMMWSSGARPINKNAKKYIDNMIDSAEERAEKEFPDDEEEQTNYIIQDLDDDYAPWIRVQCVPNIYKNDRGFEICELEIRMFLITYNGATIEKYEPEVIKFSTVTKEEKINPNYIEDDDFEFEEGGYPVDEEIINRYITNSIASYVVRF